ncbi:uncharacterized protein C8Q71DRAFT_857557 [Rhodofomes roseus]|uniref:Uncharacterized protein n=1 Tax=Rhodofomes roseus TaxID=34475 RepID=A0ABQ8KHX1_9APHY|nr:uncharacterized protein C8Q71DRAFT_857557 [Rhodofomes roseus]KAH9837244.1 hypothetical protein C8Q71DRAFT_857557 [Rhodofomes roseus]
MSENHKGCTFNLSFLELALIIDPSQVTRGHKAAMNNASVSEEAKDNSRRTLAGFEGSENPEDFNASVASEETHNYDPHNASELGDRLMLLCASVSVALRPADTAFWDAIKTL